jgi:hypothetical protein
MMRITSSGKANAKARACSMPRAFSGASLMP